MTYRVLVSTDLGGDPDDIQSLYRLILYSDVLKVEGITSCTGPGSTPSAGLIRHWIQLVDVEHLRCNGFPELMTEQVLLDSVVQGATTAGRPASGKESDGSCKIIDRAMVDSDEILWVPVWGYGCRAGAARCTRDCGADPDQLHRVVEYSERSGCS